MNSRRSYGMFAPGSAAAILWVLKHTGKDEQEKRAEGKMLRRF
jgi:hypothetical protein